MIDPEASERPGALVDDYLKLWDSETRPDLDDYISQAGSLKTDVLAEIVRIDMRQRWMGDGRRLSEYYLERFPSLNCDRDAVLDVIYTEFLLLEREGPVDLPSFLQRFPSVRDLLKAQIELHQLASDPPHEEQIRYSTDPMQTVDHPAGVSFDENPTITSDGRFRLIRKLGKGGMGTVWEAEDLLTERRVAIKMINATYSWSNEAKEQLVKEGQLAASISHRRCAYVFGVGFHRSQAYLVMEFLPGKTLREVVESDESLSLSQKIDCIIDVIDGLMEVHRVGLIHRDVKPSNCFVDGSGRIQLGDFGLAIPRVNLSGQEERFLGTPAFAAPEQMTGRGVDEKTDQYGVGATLYFLLSGRPPFLGSIKSIKNQLLNRAPLPLRGTRTKIPIELERIVMKCLSKDPASRYPSLKGLRQALQPFSKSQSALANIGKRMSAYAIDQILIWLLINLFVLIPFLLYVFATSDPDQGEGGHSSLNDDLVRCQFAAAVAFVLVQQSYYWILEGWLGAGLGKFLLGLRVVGPDSGPPGLGRTFFRSLMLPGSFGIVVLDPFLIQVATPTATTETAFDVNQSFLGPILYGQIHNAILLITISTIRASNRYRGLHEWLSQTTTIALSRSEEHAEVLPSPSQPKLREEVWGPFSAIESIGRIEGGELWRVYDRLLKRPAWLIAWERSFDEEPFAVLPRQRPTRLRWLQRGVHHGIRWDAYEEFQGIPMVSSSVPGKFDSWDRARIVLANLAHELSETEKNLETPAVLTPLQLLVHPSGQLKLLEFSFPVRESKNEVHPQWLDDHRALHLFLWVVDRLASRKEWPPDYHRFKQGLDLVMVGKGEAWEKLAILRTSLSLGMERKTTMQWEDRAYLTCATFFVETMVYLIVIVTAAFWFLNNENDPFSIALGWHVGFSLALPLWQPLIFKSSLLMRYVDVVVTKVDGRPVGRIQAAARDLIAWLPFLLTSSLGSWLAAYILLSRGKESVFLKPLLESLGIAEIAIGLMAFGYFLINGALLIATPSRNLADYLAATRLFMK